MTVDNGGAPCVAHGLLTLAICKPIIRSSAKVCDWVFGFGGVPLEGRLIYIAQVNDKLINGAYYRAGDYPNRPDCIYKYKKGDSAYVLRKNARYHGGSSDLTTDLGDFPNYPSANVLLSCNFRYLGKEGKTLGEMKGEYLRLEGLLDNLNQGHRVNHDAELANELEGLRKEVWDKYVCKVVGTPSDKDPSKRCSDDCGSAEVNC